jgi:hypothetical protein
VKEVREFFKSWPKHAEKERTLAQLKNLEQKYEEMKKVNKR